MDENLAEVKSPNLNQIRAFFISSDAHFILLGIPQPFFIILRSLLGFSRFPILDLVLAPRQAIDHLRFSGIFIR